MKNRRGNTTYQSLAKAYEEDRAGPMVGEGPRQVNQATTFRGRLDTLAEAIEQGHARSDEILGLLTAEVKSGHEIKVWQDSGPDSSAIPPLPPADVILDRAENAIRALLNTLHEVRTRL